jgi:hypothetical protein
LLLTLKLLNQGFLLVKMKSSLRKCYGRHHDLELAFHSFNRTRWRLFQTHAVLNGIHVYVFIPITGLIPLLVDY